MKYKWTANRVSYSIEITPGHLELIDRHDDCWDTVAETLSGRIDALEGQCGTDYNEHFGPYIFLNIDFPDDSLQTRERVNQLINDYTVHAILALLIPQEDE